MRRQTARHPRDRHLWQEIDELCQADPDVARWWEDGDVSEFSAAHRGIRHPLLGDLAFNVELLSTPQDRDQHLVIYTAEPHSPTARMMPLLDLNADLVHP